MTQNKTDFSDAITTDADREKLSGLLSFAQGVLTARDKVQMTMGAGLGVFHEGDIAGLPGVHLDDEDGNWLRIERQRDTRPPEPASYIAAFMVTPPTDPAKPPVMKPAISVEVTIEEASDLMEGGLVRPDNAHPIIEKGLTLDNWVKVVLHDEDCPEMRREFEAYVKGPWADWAIMERPVRRAMSLYNDLFQIHSAIHTAEATPPELVWGMGIGRWAKDTVRIDMPVIEQLVDIDLSSDGVILITPRDLSPSLSLKPYLEIEVDGSDRLQRKLQESLNTLLQNTENEISPFTTAWEPLVSTAAASLSSTGRHISREELDQGAKLPGASEELCITSSWAIFGRPRSAEARTQDLVALKAFVDKEGSNIPAAIRGYVSPAPDPIAAPQSDWGIDISVIGGKVTAGWTAPDGPSREPSATPTTTDPENSQGHRVHFFPLPFNEEQGKISDLLEDPSIDVVCVSGPPGTGKSHSIANISHLMSTGKRVLVTARTPEAIGAVREKLPKSLQPLVIASTGTDRDSAKQLQEAVTELSNEVVGLDVDFTRETMARLEQTIINCDVKAAEADRMLGEIARANLAPLTWKGKEHAPMDLVPLLAAEQEKHGWFTDRPKDAPAAQLADVLARLKRSLRDHAADMVYAGAELPDPMELPSTADLITAHEAELTHARQEPVDYSGAPVMARDQAGADDMALAALAELEACAALIADYGPRTRAMAIACLVVNSGISRKEVSDVLGYLGKQSGFEVAAFVRFDLGDCTLEDFEAAAKRGAAGQKPIGFSLFGGALKSAVASVQVGGTAPAGTDDWRAVAVACRLQRQSYAIESEFAALIRAEMATTVPREGWAIATYLKSRQTEIRAAVALADRLVPVIAAMKALFPYGLDIKAVSERLDCAAAIFAFRANLQQEHQPPACIKVLEHLAGDAAFPVLGAMSDLAAAIGDPETDPANIIRLRGEITKDLERLVTLAPELQQIGRDLQMLADCGAPEWADRLKAEPLDADDLIPDDWQSAWAWAQMKGRVEKIVSLGNGDEYRKAKADAMQTRRQNFEKLIRTRTLLGLHRRMTPSIRSAMQAFTQAVSKIGTGKGKKAPRFIRAAQDAARQASRAAPVWIMPEYRIPEQLPPEFGDFDLVILDEASQSDVTAIAALARGKKILVVGDEEQVSPTAVGIPMQKINALRAEHLDGLPNAALIDENTSIFEITKRMYPSSHVMLREHFRCVAPIIQFSNRFYGNALVPLRVPRASERFDPPLCDVFIRTAVRQGKTNASEAKWIVDEIARLVADPAHDGRDIGVISLIGNEQSEKIGRMLIEDKRIGTEVIKKRNIIYGDARTMQGQERSIVFLSMVATPGKVVSQTAKSDQQRINVAMSRAKDRLYLVRSVAQSDLKQSDIKLAVLQHFEKPMPDGRAHTGPETDGLISRCQSGFEREVLQRLLDANYRVRPQVAAGGFFIDMVVEGEGDRRLAIELDGDAYHGPDVWARDMARQAALERAGWVFWRVFGSQWNQQKEYWWQNLLGTLHRMQIAPIGATPLDERFTETIEVDPRADYAYLDGDDFVPPAPGTDLQDELTSYEPGEIFADGPPEVMDKIFEARREEQRGRFSLDDSLYANLKPEDDLQEKGQDEPAGLAQDQAPVDRPKRPTLTVPRSAAKARQAAFDLPADDLFARANGRSAKIAVGSTVLLQRIEDGSHFEITVVENQNDPDKSLVSIHAPLGEALIDAVEGDDVEYHVGSHTKEVRVLRVQ
ncbi:MAG: AAA domain-containing protein [Paracoccaceae bacterium]|nr:AAA domain-containing protein [Paracoccaceae bacterium]